MLDHIFTKLGSSPPKPPLLPGLRARTCVGTLPRWEPITSRNAGSFRQPGPTGRAHCVGVFDTAVSCRRKMRKCSEKITCTASESINCRSGVPVWQPRRHALNLGCGPSFNAVGALNKEPRHCFPGLPAPGACMYSF